MTEAARDAARGGHLSILAFGDDAAVLADVAAIGGSLGVPVERAGTLAHGLTRMAAATADVIPLLALGGGTADAAVEQSLRALADHARRRRRHAVAIVPVERIDLAMASADDPAILLLCAPAPADIAAALTLLASPALPAVADERDRSLYPELRQLSEQVLDMARTLARLTGDVGGQVAGRPLLRSARPVSAADARVGIDAAYVRAIIRGRRLRDDYFAGDLFADPVWDMLLDLTAARFEQRDVPVSSLCAAAAVAPTTALRRIRELTDAGLFVRRADPDDGRRVFIALSDAAAESMIDYLAAARRVSSPVS